MSMTDNKLASIDSIFDDDHFVCCQLDGYSGFTIAFCGAPVVEDGDALEIVDSVGCEKCNEVAEDDNFCPLRGTCLKGGDYDG